MWAWSDPCLVGFVQFRSDVRLVLNSISTDLARHAAFWANRSGRTNMCSERLLPNLVAIVAAMPSRQEAGTMNIGKDEWDRVVAPRPPARRRRNESLRNESCADPSEAAHRTEYSGAGGRRDTAQRRELDPVPTSGHSGQSWANFTAVVC